MCGAQLCGALGTENLQNFFLAPAMTHNLRACRRRRMPQRLCAGDAFTGCDQLPPAPAIVHIACLRVAISSNLSRAWYISIQDCQSSEHGNSEAIDGSCEGPSGLLVSQQPRMLLGEMASVLMSQTTLRDRNANLQTFLTPSRGSRETSSVIGVN